MNVDGIEPGIVFALRAANEGNLESDLQGGGWLYRVIGG